MKKILLAIDESLYSRIRELAFYEQSNVTQLMRNSIEGYISQTGWEPKSHDYCINCNNAANLNTDNLCYRCFKGKKSS